MKQVFTKAEIKELHDTAKMLAIQDGIDSPGVLKFGGRFDHTKKPVLMDIKFTVDNGRLDYNIKAVKVTEAEFQRFKSEMIESGAKSNDYRLN